MLFTEASLDDYPGLWVQAPRAVGTLPAANGVKGVMVDFMDRDDQLTVNFFRRVAEEAAKRKMFVNYHGAFKPTGLERRFPGPIDSERNDSGTPSVSTGPQANLRLSTITVCASSMWCHGYMRFWRRNANKL